MPETKAKSGSSSPVVAKETDKENQQQQDVQDPEMLIKHPLQVIYP